MYANALRRRQQLLICPQLQIAAPKVTVVVVNSQSEKQTGGALWMTYRAEERTQVRRRRPGTSTMAVVLRWIVLLSSAGIVGPAVADDSETLDEIRRCAHIEGRDIRVECLDLLANKVLREDDVSDEASRISEGTYPVQAPAKESSKSAKKAIRAVLTKCKKNNEGKYLFYLENGQIWKQANKQNKRYRPCEGSITIVRDLMGYKMIRTDDGSYVRVRRLR